MVMPKFIIKKNIPGRLAFLVGLLVAAAIAPTPAYSQDESITASCYKGNADEGNYIGNVSVNDPRNAGSDCNLTYEDCDDECVGCVINAESNQVCYDEERMVVE